MIRRMWRLAVALAAAALTMAEPAIDDIDYLVGPATPHFAYQLRARVRELIEDLPDDHPTRRYGERCEVESRSGRSRSSR